MPTTSQTLWNKQLSSYNFPRLATNIQTDVCIIGAGISGLTVAYQLLKAGRQVVIVDRSTVGSGETSNTSAHLSNALDDRFHNLEKMHGLEKATLAGASHIAAINHIEKIIQDEKIDCEFERLDGYLFSSEDNPKEIHQEYDAALRCKINVRKQQVDKLGESLVFPNQAIFHPMKYLAGLTKAIIAMGGKIYEHTLVSEIKKEPLQVKTADGCTIAAKKVVTATNSPFFVNLTMHVKIDPQRSYIVGLKIQKNTVKNALYWDTCDPYHYVRVEALDDEYDVLIIGGEDHRVGLTANADAFAHLTQWAKKQFGLQDVIVAYQWSGQILEPVDYLAYIGVNPKCENVYMVTGDSGNGLTHGTIAGILIADLIQNKPNPWTELYKVKRLPLRALQDFMSNAIASMIGYVKYLLPQFSAMPERGEGKVMQRGIKKIAVYKDEKDQIKECSAICSHMGAVLTWNKVEKSWDCPAHGSRFDTDGKILNGPASSCIHAKK